MSTGSPSPGDEVGWVPHPPPPSPGSPRAYRPESLGVLRGALLLWVALLGLHLVGAWLRDYVDDRIWEWTLAGLQAGLVVAFVLRDRATIGRLLRQPGSSTWLWVLPCLAGTWAFMTVYAQVCASVGIVYLPITGFGLTIIEEFVLVSICPAIFEELAFRGVIFGRLRRVMKNHDALIVQAALFSVLHLLPVMYVSHFIIGLVFGWLRMRSDSLYPSMALHALWNGFVLAQDLGWVGIGLL